MTSHLIMALFPGQGSQKVGMGHPLFEGSEECREVFSAADRALGFELSKICFEGPAEKLTGTDIAQPAILTVSVACYKLAQKFSGEKFTVACGAGHSLGEYSALVAAGAIKFEDAVQLVHKRGRYMQEAVPVGAGKMIAVLGKEIEEIESCIKNVSSGVTAIANVNAPGQIVVAGAAGAIDEFISKLGTAKVMPLQVSAPFHCPLMKPAEENLRGDLKSLSISAPSFPVYANFSATPVSNPDEIRESLANQVCGRVRWTECVANGVGDHSPEAFVEFGAGNVLSGLVKRVKPEIPRHTVGSIEEAQSILT